MFVWEYVFFVWLLALITFNCKSEIFFECLIEMGEVQRKKKGYEARQLCFFYYDHYHSDHGKTKCMTE